MATLVAPGFTADTKVTHLLTVGEHTIALDPAEAEEVLGGDISFKLAAALGKLGVRVPHPGQGWVLYQLRIRCGDRVIQTEAHMRRVQGKR